LKVILQIAAPIGLKGWRSTMTQVMTPSGETTLSGSLVDQAALFGVLTKIHALNLTLISIKVRGSFTFFIVMLNALCKRH